MALIGGLVGYAERSVAASPGTIYLNDNFEDRPVETISNILPALWTNKGYTEIINNPRLTTIDRTTMTAGLKADGNFPVGKNRLLRGAQTAAEDEAHMVWEFADTGGTQGIRSAYVSWWEYRPDSKRAGEKFCRLGNRISYPGGNRRLDIILYLGQSGVMGVIANSANMFDFGDIPIATTNAWDGHLSHWEFNVNLSTGINANGSVQVWQDSVSLGSASGLRMFLNTTDALTNLELFEIGGWNSGTAGGWQAWPIDRNFPQWKVADYRLGVWPITTTTPP